MEDAVILVHPRTADELKDMILRDMRGEFDYEVPYPFELS